MGRDPLSNAEPLELRGVAAKMDALVASGASCDAIDEWLADRYANDLGIVDAKAVSLFGAASVAWGNTDASIKFGECFGPG